jgi:hypothetical protein
MYMHVCSFLCPSSDKFGNFVNELQAIKDRNMADVPTQSAFRK